MMYYWRYFKLIIWLRNVGIGAALRYLGMAAPSKTRWVIDILAAQSGQLSTLL